MNIRQKRRGIGILILITSLMLALGLVLEALRHNINLFLTPSALQQHQVPLDKRIRVGGRVKKGSLLKKEDLKIEFIIADPDAEIAVQYTGLLPDLFKEEQGVVAAGRINAQHVLVADEILAKHDENYIPPTLSKGKP